MGKNWQVKSLGEILYFHYGKGLKKISREETGKYPVYGSNGVVGYHSEYFVDVPCLIIGRKGSTGEVQYSKKKCWPIDTTYYVKESEEYSLTFFYFLLRKLRLSDLDKSTAIPGLNRNDAYRIKIFLPPLPIQKQIAEILEQAYKAKQKRKEANKLTDEFLQSVFIEMFGDPIKNPKGWDIIHFGEIISVPMDYHSNGSYETLRDNVQLLDTPDYAYMIRTTDLEKKDYETNVKYISKSAYEFLTKSKIFGGEIIMNKIGSAGQVYFMPYLNRKISLGMNQFGLRFSEKANNVFIYYLLKSNYGASIINKKVQGAVTKTITKEAVRGLLIPLPPLKLQQQFAEIVNKTEALKEKQKQSEQELENLFQSLMQKAFKGELM